MHVIAKANIFFLLSLQKGMHFFVCKQMGRLLEGKGGWRGCSTCAMPRCDIIIVLPNF